MNDAALTLSQVRYANKAFWRNPASAFWHFARGMQAGFLGTAFNWTDVLVVAAWGLGGLPLSVRFFSWEPPT